MRRLRDIAQDLREAGSICDQYQADIAKATQSLVNSKKNLWLAQEAYHTLRRELETSALED